MTLDQAEGQVGFVEWRVKIACYYLHLGLILFYLNLFLFYVLQMVLFLEGRQGTMHGQIIFYSLPLLLYTLSHVFHPAFWNLFLFLLILLPLICGHLLIGHENDLRGLSDPCPIAI